MRFKISPNSTVVLFVFFLQWIFFVLSRRFTFVNEPTITVLQLLFPFLFERHYRLTLNRSNFNRAGIFAHVPNIFSTFWRPQRKPNKLAISPFGHSRKLSETQTRHIFVMPPANIVQFFSESKYAEDSCTWKSHRMQQEYIEISYEWSLKNSKNWDPLLIKSSRDVPYHTKDPTWLEWLMSIIGHSPLKIHHWKLFPFHKLPSSID